MTITASVVITQTTPFGPAAVFGATKQEIVLEFAVNVSTMAEVEERVSSLIRAGLAPDASERAFEAAYGLPPTVDASGDLRPLDEVHTEEEIRSVVSRADLGGPVVGPSSHPEYRTPERMAGGKHSGDCQCSRCVEPDAPDDTPSPIVVPPFDAPS